MPLNVPPASPGTRSRSVSQPLREGIQTDFFTWGVDNNSPRQYGRNLTPTNNGGSDSYGRRSSNTLMPEPPRKGRTRSGSLVAVTEVGGDEPDSVNDRVGVGANNNVSWVNSPGAWVIHPVLIISAKILIDAIPHMSQDLCWTIVNLGYMIVTFIMFHHHTGVPFENAVSTGGAYDDLTLWEQIDQGAQYTPAKKWLTSVPIALFLISTHYTHYNYILFALNFTGLVAALFPKLPILHRLRFHFLPFVSREPATPAASRPASPGPR